MEEAEQLRRGRRHCVERGRIWSVRETSCLEVRDEVTSRVQRTCRNAPACGEFGREHGVSAREREAVNTTTACSAERNEPLATTAEEDTQVVLSDAFIQVHITNACASTTI